MHNLLYKYKELSKQKKAVIWFVLATLIQNGILFLMTPIYTRIMPASDYGTFSLYQSWQQIISIVSILAIDRCITVGFVKFENEKEKFLSSVQMLMTILIIISCLIVFVFERYLSIIIDLPVYIIYLMLLISLLNNTMLNWSWYQRYNNNYIKLFVVTIVSTVIMQILGICFVLFLNTSNKGINLILGMSIGRLLIYGYLYMSLLLQGKKLFCKKYYSFALTYSIAVVPHALSQIILNSSDRIMIEKYCGMEKAAYYGIAYSIVMIASILITSISSAVQPWFFKKLKNKEYLDIGSKVNDLLIISAIIVLSVIVFSPEILIIMAPGSYKEALWVIPSISASVYFNGLFLYFSNIESFYEKPIYFSIATTIGAVLNIILNMIFIPKFGFVFAGYSTLICFILFAILHFIFMKKICKKEIGNINVFDNKFIFVLSLAVLIISELISLLYFNNLIRYCIVLFALIILIIFRKKIIEKVKKILLN